MELNELDLDLLELLALRVPWYMVCGDFNERYGGAGSLACRIFELEHAGLIEIRTRRGGRTPSIETLEADAATNDCYLDLEASREPEWDLVATDAGHAYVRDRLGAQ